ncbi:MAG: thiol oxidoreductase [Planctomycetes bacterium]|nr:thiol oxidoreductase [Planctomycetota bacterium]
MTRSKLLFMVFGGGIASALLGATATAQNIGEEKSIPTHLADGDEFTVKLKDLLAHGRALFSANWTIQDGGGRPMTKGTGGAIADPTDPLVFPRNFNRISAPDANSCAGCHNAPFGIPGGGGDIVGNVFVLGQRFDFATMSASGSNIHTKGGFDEVGTSVTLQTIANSRATLGMFGSGFIEMLSRQMTTDLQALRDTLPNTGGTVPLVTKSVSFGTLVRNANGTWDTSQVTGLVAPSLSTSGQTGPSLIIRPFHQASNVVSIRQFTNNALNHHHGIQTTERFGANTDADGDGVMNEATRADVTAMAVFQATMAVPGRVIPKNKTIEAAITLGEQKFSDSHCVDCHIPFLPLDNNGWMYVEPNPFNPNSPPNLQPGAAPDFTVDLTNKMLPGPRLKPNKSGVINVPAFTDLKVHDITTGAGDPNREVLDMNQAAGSGGFFAGNGRFITKKLWGCANEAPFFHHGQYVTLRQAIVAHAGEAATATTAFNALTSAEQDAVIEFLKTLQVLKPGTTSLIVDEKGHSRKWTSIFD